jgi:predicted nucleic acid-binding protein
MRKLVLDASVLLKWFGGVDEAGVAAARELRAAFEGGELVVVAPPFLNLEIVNVAGRRWGWPADQLADLAAALQDLPLELRDPSLSAVAMWVATGLTAYDAVYVALAESEQVPLITADDRVLSLAPAVARPLGADP